MEKYISYIEEQLENLVNIPSPSGYTKEIALYLRDVLTKMGYESRITPKGTVISSMGGIGERIILAAHVDTLGAMVRTIKE
ncbi:MAG: peptidase M42, partial [Oscillospiraceae bacterium]